MTFDVPDILVSATQKYWFTYVEYVSRDSPSQSITNLGSCRGNQYRQGQLLRQNRSEPSDDEDAKFRIVAECPPIPGLREPTEKERARVPSPLWSNGHWRELPPCASRQQRESAWSSKILGLTGRLVVRQEPHESRYGLSMDLYNDSGRALLVSLWNPKSIRISVWSQDGKMVAPTEESLRAIYGSDRQVSLPAHGYVGYSIPGSGRIRKSGRGAILQWNGWRWALPPGVYELRSEYMSLSGTSPIPEGTHLWDGRLTLPPVRIAVKEDGTAGPVAPPDNE